MECLSENDLLQFNSNTLEAVRKLRGFNSQREVNDAVNILETWAKTQDHFLKKNFGNYFLFSIFRLIRPVSCIMKS